MRGKSVFYPIGWDDNGLPTERRVQNYFGVRCDPELAYQPGLTPPGPRPDGKAMPPRDQLPVSRRNFVEFCLQLTGLDEQAYEEAWRRLGLSVDWDTRYQTIDERSRTVSQRAFLRNLARGEAYSAQGPALWDVTFRTAVAQAELEEREVPGAYWRIAFPLDTQSAGPPDRGPRDSRPGDSRPGDSGSRDTRPREGGEGAGAELVVATTRPELLAACVALVAHPDDARYAGLIGTMARTPLFGAVVPVLAHRLADPAKGTGLVMVCTFGDTTDVIWWRELQLATRPVIGRGGRMAGEIPAWISAKDGQRAYQQLAGQTAKAARETMTGLLREAGALRGDPEPMTHPVKFYEKGDRPLEIVTTRQWYIRNGGRDPELRETLQRRGRELAWHPPHMLSRYENWVGGLAGDWLISRQRFFGVPIPVWYPVGDDGQPRLDSPVAAPDQMLPVDPAADVPPGYQEDQRGRPGGFTADPDVMDTWATASLTPQIAGGWSIDDDLFGRVFPMDMRPQAHEIIRTWLFYAVLRSHLEHRRLPWRHVAISGWILDPDRKKMSKSAGNVVTPMDMLRDYGSDAVRYWAASARLGVDTAFDPAQLKIGRRLAVKILNASKFVLGIGAAAGAGLITEPLDRALLHRLAGVAEQCSTAFESYDHALALELTERFFWLFCDDYLELVKPRAYGEQGEAAAGSAIATLRTALLTVLRLFAPFLPFVTEEAWSWRQPGQDGSVHLAAWPDAAELRALGGPDDAALDAASAAIASIRKAKSQAQLPMRAPVRRLSASGPADQLDALAAVLRDVRLAGRVEAVDLHPAGGPDTRLEVTI